MRRVLFFVLFVATAQTAFAQDPVSVDAKHYKVMFENDQVRVLKIHYNPKEKSVMHEHPASVVVFLNTSKAKFTLADGTVTTDGGGKAGSVRFTDAGKHLPENIGAVPIEAVLIELKGKAGSASAVALDPVKIDPTRHKVEVENAQLRVLRIKLKARDKTTPHEHPNGVAVFLTDGKTRFTLPDGKIREAAGKRGEAIWAPAEKHSVNNLLARPVEVIFVELK
jgi:quercetin dioxygenase-like cupin family protein